MISATKVLRDRRLSLIPLLSCLLLTLGGGSGCERRVSSLEVLSGTTMGTTWTVKFQRPDCCNSGEAATELRSSIRAALDAELEAVNDLMSVFRRKSEISRFNQSHDSGWINVSRALAELVAYAQEVHRLSGGSLDVTIGPVIRLWGFGPGGARRVPSEAEIAAAMARSGGSRLEVRRNPPALRKKVPELECNLSSLAKGYGVDRLSVLLEEQGITDYLVEIGGEMRARGERHGGGPWHIGVMEPEASGGLQRVIPLENRSMATSGDYQNYFEVGGIRYSHTMDPRTGRPVTHNLASVTVVADTCMEADAWATALLVMGPLPAMALARERKIPAFFIERTVDGYREFMTSAFRHLLEKNSEGGS